MSMTVIKVENLSKMYDLGLVGTGTLSKDINRSWARLRGKHDPYATIAEINDRTQSSKSGTVWALKDINFEVQAGEVLGIIGKNGAGKSTLLKILSQITAPTNGQIKIRGRVASLLEVGTGMHPEMTARQNIFLNGSIMGMTRREILSRLDEIIDFAGIAKYIDTPIKRFSSGMQVRLGFAVAAFLEPEILIVDEVLAVGDAEFQKKAIGKMQDVSRGDGRTVLFVSHNMASIQSLCSSAILLEDGKFLLGGSVKEAIGSYLKLNLFKSKVNLSDRHDRINGKNFRFINVNIISDGVLNGDAIKNGKDCSFRINYCLKNDININIVRIVFYDEKGIIRMLCSTSLLNVTPKFCSKTENHSVSFEFDNFPLPRGSYFFNLECISDNGVEDSVENAGLFDVIDGDFFNTGKVPAITDGVLVKFKASW